MSNTQGKKEAQAHHADADHVEVTTRDEELQGWVSLAEDAREATAEEHRLTFTQAVRMYPKACMWTMVVSLVVILDGYDTALIGSLFAFPAFQSQFGYETSTPGKYQLEPKWQTALGLASPLGNIVGIYINAFLTEKWGHKKTCLGTLAFLTGVLFIPFFAKNVQVLFVGELLCGLAWGVFTTLAPAYASEVTPVVLRSYLETYVVLCWGIGQFVATGILDSLNHRTDDWAWRIPLAVQWVWPVIITPLLIFAPESPWWLVRKGRVQEAEKSIRRLSSSQDPDHAKKSVALMVQTTRLEKEITEGASFIDCLRGPNAWRTEIGCIVWSSQALCGFAITSYSTYFYEQAGLATSDAYKMSVGQSGLHFLCTLLSVFITGNFGRRPILFFGYVGMCMSMLILGIMACVHQTSGLGYGESAMFLLWYVFYELTLGPLAFIIVGEISSTRLRSKSISLARNAYNVANVFSATVAPYTLNPTAANWKGKTAFLAAGFTMIVIVWAWFRLPESRGRTYEELDILFSMDLKAREFADAQIDGDAADDLTRKS
jgi:SP family general alpha glucoside:H+ symporter-like MFS transporter